MIKLKSKAELLDESEKIYTILKEIQNLNSILNDDEKLRLNSH